MIGEPSPNGANGRTAGGRFAKGNAGGPGNPHARHVARLRAALLKAVTPVSLKRIIGALLVKAEQGDVQAAREVLDRCLGKTVATIELGDVDSLTRPPIPTPRHTVSLGEALLAMKAHHDDPIRLVETDPGG